MEIFLDPPFHFYKSTAGMSSASQSLLARPEVNAADSSLAAAYPSVVSRLLAHLKKQPLDWTVSSVTRDYCNCSFLHPPSNTADWVQQLRYLLDGPIVVPAPPTGQQLLSGQKSQPFGLDTSKLQQFWQFYPTLRGYLPPWLITAHPNLDKKLFRSWLLQHAVYVVFLFLPLTRANPPADILGWYPDQRTFESQLVREFFYLHRAPPKPPKRLLRNKIGLTCTGYPPPLLAHLHSFLVTCANTLP